MDDKLVLAAKDEMLKKGYADASLRRIAEAANTSTNSIYVRFKDKAGLFMAIVLPAMEKVEAFYAKALKEFEDEHCRAAFDEMTDYSRDRLNELVDMIYDDYDTYKLLVCCSEGMLITDWIEKLAEMESRQTVAYIEAIGSDAITAGRLIKELLHMLSSAY